MALVRLRRLPCPSSEVSSPSAGPCKFDTWSVSVIHDAQAAKYVSDLFRDINQRLLESLDNVESACTAEEFHTYKRRVATLSYSTFEQILVPIYREHPSLKPPELEI